MTFRTGHAKVHFQIYRRTNANLQTEALAATSTICQMQAASVAEEAEDQDSSKAMARSATSPTGNVKVLYHLLPATGHQCGTAVDCERPAHHVKGDRARNGVRADQMQAQDRHAESSRQAQHQRECRPRPSKYHNRERECDPIHLRFPLRMSQHHHPHNNKRQKSVQSST